MFTFIHSFPPSPTTSIFMLPLPFLKPGTLSTACQIAVTGLGARRNAPHTPSRLMRLEVYSAGREGELHSCVLAQYGVEAAVNGWTAGHGSRTT